MATADGTTVLRTSSPPDDVSVLPGLVSRVEHLPVAVFSVVMGLAGTAVAPAVLLLHPR